MGCHGWIGEWRRSRQLSKVKVWYWSILAALAKCLLVVISISMSLLGRKLLNGFLMHSLRHLSMDGTLNFPVLLLFFRLITNGGVVHHYSTIALSKPSLSSATVKNSPKLQRTFKLRFRFTPDYVFTIISKSPTQAQFPTIPDTNLSNTSILPCSDIFCPANPINSPSGSSTPILGECSRVSTD